MNEKELTPKASLTEQAVKLPDGTLVPHKWASAYYWSRIDGSAMVGPIEDLAHETAARLDLEQQLAHQMEANERMAADKMAAQVEMATLKAVSESLREKYTQQACSDFADIHRSYRQLLEDIDNTLCACRHRDSIPSCNCDIHAAHRLIQERLSALVIIP